MKQRTEEQRRALVKAWRHSGESIRTFAKRNGVGVSTFYEWSRHATMEQSSAAFAQVDVVKPRATAAVDSHLELVVADVTLRIPSNVDRQLLTTVLELVRRC